MKLVFCYKQTNIILHSHNSRLTQEAFHLRTHCYTNRSTPWRWCTTRLIILHSKTCWNCPIQKVIMGKTRMAHCKNRPFQFYLELLLSGSSSARGSSRRTQHKQWSALANSRFLYRLLTVEAYESTKLWRLANIHSSSSYEPTRRLKVRLTLYFNMISSSEMGTVQ